MSMEGRGPVPSPRGYEQTGYAVTCRSMDEYLRMFSLEEERLHRGPVLDVAAGASSFTAMARRKGIDAFAADPTYAMDADDMEKTGYEEIEVSTEKLDALRDSFDWSYYGSPEHHRKLREASFSQFIESYRTEGSQVYTEASLPNLPFAEERFSLVLCSHFLFLYGQGLDEQFHLEACRELLRICRPGGEVRIYPLLDLSFKEYPGLDILIQELEDSGASVRMMESRLAFIPGSKHLLCLTKKDR